MDRISDKELEDFTWLFHKIINEGGVKRPDILEKIIKELKERREADEKPLTVKEQFRLVRDKWPDVWKHRVGFYCPNNIGLKSRHKHDDFGDRDFCEPKRDCEKCWNEALKEGGKQ